jgi:hypothetical protein
MHKNHSCTTYAVKRVIYVVGVANVAVGIVGLLAPGEFLLSSGTPVHYLYGALNMEGMFTLMTAQISLYAAIIHATQKDRVGATTLCVCLPLLYPQFTPTVLTVPLLNFRAIATLPDALSMPHGGLLLVAAILWNFEQLRKRTREESRSSEVADGWSVSVFLRYHRWRIVSRIFAYTFIVACVIVPIVQRPPEYLFRIVLPFVAAATYTFVSTNSTRGTAGLATGAWIIGFATLQYDTALTGIAFPTATLLTISAAALWLSKRTDEMSQDISNYNYD